MAETLNLGTNGNWATKKESLLAYNDENNNFKPLPFNFTRDSSATRVNKEGLIEVVSNNEPRIDFKDSSEGALLLEPRRSNRLSYSEDFSSWGKSGTVNLTSGIVSPKGDNSAYSVSGTGDLTMSTSLASTGTHIFSIYAKGNIGDTFRIFKSNGFSYSQDTITIDSTDWKRYQFSRDFTSTSGIIFIDNFDEGTISLWGAQLEQGSYATSYIPTSGGAVTRVADVCNNGGNEQVFNSSEGVLYAEISALANDGTERRLSLQDNGTYDAVRITFTPTANSLTAVVYNNSANQFNAVHILDDATTFNKIAIKYKQNDFALWVNGIEVATDTNGSVFSEGSLDKLSYELNGIAKVYAKTKDLRVYNTALTDQELQALTTI